jgi:SNF2 family DNA or RNA helicase
MGFYIGNTFQEANDTPRPAHNQLPITPPQLQRVNMAPQYTVDTNSRKRPAHVLSSPLRPDPPKRATPSPADSAPQTPGSDAFSDAFFNSPIQATSSRQPGQHGSRIASDPLIEQQLRLEKEAKERHVQYLRDLQIANSYSLGVPAPRPAAPSSSATQTVFNRDGSFRRVSGPINSHPIKAEPSSTFSFGATQAGPSVKREGSALASSSAGRPIKPEGAGPSFIPSQNEPSAYDPHREVLDLLTDSDSDIEEIGAEQFSASARRRAPAPNGRPATTAPGVPSSSFTGSSQYPTMARSMATHCFPQNTMHPAMTINAPTSLQSYQQAHAALQQQSQPARGYMQAMQPSQVPSYNMPGAFPGAANPLLQSAYMGNGVGGYGRAGIMRPGMAGYPRNYAAYGLPMPIINLDDDDDEDDAGDELGAYAYLRSDPTRTAEELKELLADVAKGADLKPEERRGTPEAMKFPLLEHQKIGFTWMKDRELGNPKGGILADDMGLGKTIQALALILSNPSEDRARKTTLVVAPVALLFQWELEIKDKVKTEHRLSVHIHHGAKKKAFSALKQFDVVLTTFGSLTSELKKRERWERVLVGNPNAMPSKKEQLSLLGNECRWYRVVLDEAQHIKNMQTGAAKAAFKLDSIYRWCMTGTPMMNNVFELWPLIHFCRLRPYNDVQRFRQDIKNPLEKNGNERGRKKAMEKLQALIRGIMLRRTKKSEIDGKPIVTLPQRTNDVVNGSFDQDQEDFYRQVEQQSAQIFNKYLKEGSVMRNYSHVLTLLLRLRQITDHPVLATEVVNDAGVETSAEDMLALAKKLKGDVVRRIKQNDGNFVCTICLDAIALPGPIIFFPCGHFLDSDCLSTLAMNAQSNMENEVKCPECREKFDPKKVIDYPSFQKVHSPEKLQEGLVKDDAEEEEEDEDDSDDESVDGSDSEDNLKGFVVDDDAPESEAEEVNGQPEDDEGLAPVPQAASAVRATNGRARKRKSKGKEKKVKKTLAQLRKEGRSNKKTWARYLRRLEKTWETSAKIEQTRELLDKISREKPREKILIFSQFTSFLDFLEVPLRRDGRLYQRYDGSMNMKERQAAVREFTTNPRIKIMLISLKAGNAGLNLNCASQVIILDPFWNPFIEEQAIDRAHRIGQQNEVNVHRIVIPNTVEDRILQLQDKKRDIINTALDENAGKTLSRLSVTQLAFLFGTRDDPGN